MKHALAALALLILTGASQQPQQYAHPNGDKQRSPDDLRGTDSLPFAVKVLPTPIDEEQARKEEAKEERKESSDTWIVRLTALLAAATTILAIYTLRLARATDKLVKGADRNSERQLRAYIFTRVANSNCTKALSGIARVEYGVFNKGDTPGTIIKIARKVECLPYLLPHNATIDPGAPQNIGAIIGADDAESKGIINADTLFSNSEISDMKAVPPTKRVYFHGYFSYRDVFEETRETHFCYSLVYDSINSNGATWEPADGFNRFT